MAGVATAQERFNSANHANAIEDGTVGGADGKEKIVGDRRKVRSGSGRLHNGGVVQLVRTSACHAEGREFNSPRHRLGLGTARGGRPFCKGNIR